MVLAFPSGNHEDSIRLAAPNNGAFNMELAQVIVAQFASQLIL